RSGKLSTAGAEVNTIIPVNTAASNPIMNHPRPKTNAYKRGYSQSSRPFNIYYANKNNIVNTNVNTAKVKHTTTRDRSVVSESKGKGANAVKASACWGNPQQKEYKEKAVIDSGCSRHMTGNKCYLDEYEDYDGGFVSFGDGKGGISRKRDGDDVMMMVVRGCGCRGVSAEKGGGWRLWCVAVVVWWQRVEARGGGDRIDPLVRTLFGLGRKTRRKSFPAAADGGLRWGGGGGGGRNKREKKVLCGYCLEAACASGNPQQALKYKGIFDSGCSRHMTGNKDFPTDYQDINGGFVVFGGSDRGGKITGKRKIRTDNVLVTKTECLVLSPDFKLLDESHVLLRVPMQKNMYNFDLKNVVPFGDLTCLFAKAIINESKLWHRRLGHVNFKTMNKLVKGNIIRGLPSKIFDNDHTCVACQKGKQHKASKNVSTQQYIMFPLWSSISSSYKSSDETYKNDTADDAAGETPVQKPSSENEQALKNVLDKMMDQEKEASEKTDAVRKEFEAYTPVNAASAPRTSNDAGPSFVPLRRSFPFNVNDFPDDPLMPDLEDTTEVQNTSIFGSAFNDEYLDIYNSPFADQEPTKIAQALDDESWVEAMQEELLQFKIQKMDVKSAFLYGTIEEEVYVSQPPGFMDPKFPEKVYKVEKALYGLHQAPRAWYETLSTYRLDNGFYRGQIDKTLFIKRVKGDIACGNKFQMSSKGEFTFFLGLQVKQKEDGIFISQDKYVGEILKKFGFSSIRTASTPMETNKALTKDEDGEDVDMSFIQGHMIGCIISNGRFNGVKCSEWYTSAIGLSWEGNMISVTNTVGLAFYYLKKLCTAGKKFIYF
ncbi:putative ribonuclease H-like domain-containing protein, partial [Tanacetum coccineum]